ncbi:hypothetical protein FRC15_010927 [Serendipita sp. 397]|nr:hypothetical protein FRC15_010927 [Serendipita sp. 397]
MLATLWAALPFARQLLWIVAVILALLIIRHIILLYRLFSPTRHLPCHWTLIGLDSLIGILLPHIPFINRGHQFISKQNHEIFKKNGSDIVFCISFYPFPGWIAAFVADAAVAREVSSNRVAFPKPTEVYKTVSLYGTNVVASEHEEWKLHRRVTAPSFSERNNRLVFEEGSRLVSELFDLWSKQGNASRIEIGDVVGLTTQYALMVIAAAGFGARFAWDDRQKPGAGFTFTFQEALKTLMSNIIMRIALPDRILGLWQKGRDIRDASRDFKRYIENIIEVRQQQPAEDRKSDLLSSLIAAAALENSDLDKGSSKYSFGNEELAGNVFIFLFAGHETTAHTLAFVLALLAVHQDVQRKLYESLCELVAEGGKVTYADIVRWPYGLAVFYETLRLFPSVASYPKYAAEDSTFVTYSNDGKNTPIPVFVPKGELIVIDVMALHYNPKYWKDPHEFRPERFMGDYNRDAFYPFAAGPRACMGRRFAEIEALTFLANLVIAYRFEGTPLSDRETLEERNARLLRWSMGSITIHPEKVPLTMIRR